MAGGSIEPYDHGTSPPSTFVGPFKAQKPPSQGASTLRGHKLLCPKRWCAYINVYNYNYMLYYIINICEYMNSLKVQMNMEVERDPFRSTLLCTEPSMGFQIHLAEGMW